ncbi:hypothetical protein G9A89_004428 [Geosiphon pyriformis]|nr:hypothetical protein G9A89_004428 [Geosiphon pyriformis]
METLQNLIHALRRELDIPDDNLPLCHKLREWIDENDYEPKQVFELFRNNQTQPIYQYLLGVIYENGIGTNHCQNTAFLCYLQAADADFKPAIYQVARIAISNNTYRGIRHLKYWLERAADAGSLTARFDLGRLYLQSLNYQDLNKALESFKIAYKHGLKEAGFHIGCCYMRGKGTPRDMDQAFEWFLKSAFETESSSEILLRLYRINQLNEAQVIRVFQRIQDESIGRDPEAIFRLGDCYRIGCGIKMDVRKAACCYQKAAISGSGKMQAQYGRTLLYCFGRNKDLHESLFWYRKALEKFPLEKDTEKTHIFRAISRILRY